MCVCGECFSQKVKSYIWGPLTYIFQVSFKWFMCSQEHMQSKETLHLSSWANDKQYDEWLQKYMRCPLSDMHVIIVQLLIHPPNKLPFYSTYYDGNYINFSEHKMIYEIQIHLVLLHFTDVVLKARPSTSKKDSDLLC